MMQQLSKVLPGLDWMRSYRSEWLSGDLSAGLTVGVMLVPQGMAYAMIAGLPPIYGLYASIVPLLIYALFGTSRQLGVGPVALVSLLVATGVSGMADGGSAEYIGYAIVLALLVGAIQFGLGFFRLGFLVNFLSHPVVSGFTSGAALIIGLSQLKHLVGINLPRTQKLHELIGELFAHLGEVHIPTLILGLSGVALILLTKRFAKRIPGPLVAVVFGILAVKALGLADQGVRIVGEVPSGLPAISLPSFDAGVWGQLFPIALTIALISFMESIAVAKAIQRKHRDYEVSANKELMALGLANVVGSFFQAYPTTGGFSRSAVNDQAGANTGLASIISAGLITLTLLFLTPLFHDLPKAVLASVILVAVFGLIDYKEVRHLWHNDRRDLLMLMVTFLVTITLGVESGILAGVTLSLADLIWRASRPHYAVLGRLPETGVYRNVGRFPEAKEDPGVLVLRPDGQWFYANVPYWQDVIRKQLAERNQTHALVIDAGSLPDMDSTALHFLFDLADELERSNIELRFAGLIGPVRDRLSKSGFFERLGAERFYLTVPEAVQGSHAHPEAAPAAMRSGKKAPAYA
jgi:SulP family sulfate permease